jgi:NAD(P)-dependent dehydrogenase (short-subunit alcohol dehydrogenase family)
MARRSFAGKTVLVTGAGGGLGRAIALRFAQAGARIAALDRDAAGVERLREEIARPSPTPRPATGRSARRSGGSARSTCW